MIHVEVHGGDRSAGSPPLVLIHGSGGSRLHWPPAVRRLPGIHVLALDLPGHGLSPGPAPDSIEGYADRVLEWLNATLDEPTVIAGHSMGGAITLALARHDPGRLAGMALIGSGARLRVHPEILAATADDTTYPSAVDQIMAWAFSPTAPARLVALARRRMLEVRPDVVNADFRACNAFDMMTDLDALRTPALVVCGTEDRLTPLKYSEYLTEHLPQARLVTVQGAGHMVMLEQPEQIARALREFLARPEG